MLTERPITSFKCLTFDCFATLVDWEEGLWTALATLRQQLSEAQQDRSVILKSFIKHEDKIMEEHPRELYKAVLAMTYGRMAAEFGVPASEEDKTKFGDSVGDWPAFADTLDALKRLHKHFKLVILSNVDLVSFKRTLTDQMPGIDFDAIYTAQEIGTYKPDLNNFEYMVSHLEKDHGVKKEDIIHTAQSLFHDHVPAKQFGLVSAWIERGEKGESAIGGKPSDFGDKIDLQWRFKTMGEMADFVDAQAAKST